MTEETTGTGIPQRFRQFSLWTMILGTTAAGVFSAMWQYYPNDYRFAYYLLCSYVAICVGIVFRLLTDLLRHAQ